MNLKTKVLVKLWKLFQMRVRGSNSVSTDLALVSSKGQLCALQILFYNNIRLRFICLTRDCPSIEPDQNQ
jgi:hypothetical protein